MEEKKLVCGPNEVGCKCNLDLPLCPHQHSCGWLGTHSPWRNRNGAGHQYQGMRISYTTTLYKMTLPAHAQL